MLLFTFLCCLCCHVYEHVASYLFSEMYKDEEDHQSMELVGRTGCVISRMFAVMHLKAVHTNELKHGEEATTITFR
jgi:hypothetical protein